MSSLHSLEKLKNFLTLLTSIPPMEWIQFAHHLKSVNLKKGEFLFREKEDCSIIGYVTHGLIYTYYLTSDGKEKTKNFAWEGRLISPYASIIQNQPTNFTAVALEPTTVITFDAKKLSDFQKRHRCWETVSRKCTEKILIERELREFEFLTQTNEERIESFYKYYYPIIERIPQYLIANYIGITPVSLSRIRAKKS
jgi:CRP-like cAMP-binding protein